MSLETTSNKAQYRKEVYRSSKFKLQELKIRSFGSLGFLLQHDHDQPTRSKQNPTKWRETNGLKDNFGKQK